MRINLPMAVAIFVILYIVVAVLFGKVKPEAKEFFKRWIWKG